MGDHLVLLVDRLLTESTLEAAKNQSQQGITPESKVDIIKFSSHRMEGNVGSSPSKLVECRICHDEEEDLNMEIPCSCRGSLKYAHRKCVQRWCDEKGDTICEICRQQYKPGYVAPSPTLFRYGGFPMNFRGNWGISGRDSPAPQFIAMVTPDHDFLESDFDDYLAPNSRSVVCCRVVAIIFTVLVVLRHALPIIISGAEDYSLTLSTLVLLCTIAILLPIYIMVKAFSAAIQRRRRQHQEPRFSLAASDEESDLPQLEQQQQQQQTRLRSVRVH
ncbi:E3 ubiquitin-protein ligase MARCH2 [Gossypium arboreum]|uniref:E3 ubiquitin-protein ligase MARCH2 n=2 Tax=Gossypium arboreum TaxID=29729 RepID=A0A0B0PHH2_GOSAR|nr:uncharacterized protein LOC108471058 [Gossypium arboreum]XP_017628127.1 uncharacterized protein LOC108471058 [Gossypium arboreum]XP_017628135.1 uncharacterized protein LOC108471058 [Gossypium arboreum]XP_017628143.1 uncharacterized protein LOC108471058 [Gossypium arboreum]XP_017628152.1 uncharacterized protein LOC108471058 [Gossypium arboreum]XP_017628159.1 uncharacterized protein LOC108471058 [Gossypium arboreum]XP_017628167.1 uncharacterized protein LOC108471058 [Gossypium arboreum]XP_0